MSDAQRIDPVLVEKAMLAAYAVAPQYDGATGRPKTYEECYGVAPLDHRDDREEMEAVIRALGLKDERGWLEEGHLCTRPGPPTHRRLVSDWRLVEQGDTDD